MLAEFVMVGIRFEISLDLSCRSGCCSQVNASRLISLDKMGGLRLDHSPRFGNTGVSAGNG